MTVKEFQELQRLEALLRRQDRAIATLQSSLNLKSRMVEILIERFELDDDEVNELVRKVKAEE